VKILLVNNFYYNRGGDCTYLFSLKGLLERNGHTVVIFSMHHPQNYESVYSKYFVSYINYSEEVKNKNLSSGFKVLFRSIYSREAKKRIEQLIKEEKPDIAHLNNIRHHITTSIMSPLKKNKIPIVWTLHDYQLICPNISFLAKGRICERCKKRKYFWPPLIKCKKDSFFASAMAAIEHTAQIITKAYDSVDVFICPSEFLRNKFIEYDFYESKLTLLHHFIDIDWNKEGETPGDYILFIGRLTEEKGVKTLLDAAANSDSCELKIIGDGPLKETLVSYAETKKNTLKTEFLGHKSRGEVIEILKKCKFLIIPSEWYEITGLVMFEAFACGKPVIGSRIGGITEFIRENETGLTFEPGNADDLSAKIKYLINNPAKIVEMGENARMFSVSVLNAKTHYKKLMEIYEQAMEHNKNGR
jgi:glycosyltransferase involved in cell wall biosynthesis